MSYMTKTNTKMKEKMILTALTLMSPSHSTNLKPKILHEIQFLSMWLRKGGNRTVFTLSLQLF